MKSYELLKLQETMFNALIKSGVGMEDVKYIPVYEEYKSLIHEGNKKEYVFEILKSKHNIGKNTIRRLVKRMNRDVAL